MRLLEVDIINLFNTFTHNIKLNQEDRVTIITAPNGYGKTIALKVIHSLFNKKFTFFIKLKFNKINFMFDDSSAIEIIKHDDKLNFKLKKNTKLIKSFDYSNKKLLDIKKKISTRAIENYLPPIIERISPDSWLNEVTGEVLSFEDILQLGENFPDNISNKFKFELPKEFLDIINLMEVYLIQEQRLVLREPALKYRGRVVITDTIEKYSQELSYLIKGSIDKYAEITQSLDSSFPKRLFQETIDIENKNKLKEKLSLLQEKRQKLSEYGLLKSDDNSFFTDDIKDDDTKVLFLYISDSEKKLSVFDNLIDRIDVFTKILNERRFTFKSIEIDKDKGFIFKTNQDEVLKLTELSSGEQHEVVLLFELLFKAKENSLVLIDEPEISLHVVWQKAFLNDIKEIISLQKIDIVIATHSPQIINDKWDLTVNLEDSCNG